MPTNVGIYFDSGGFKMKTGKNFCKERLMILIIILILVAFVCFYEDFTLSNCESDVEHIEIPSVSSQQQIVITEVIELVELSKSLEQRHITLNGEDITLTQEEEELLLRLAMAEAGNQSTEGKALVMLVVLNRTLSNDFPDTIEEVIFQESDGIYQFSPIGNGYFYQVEPSDDCVNALEMLYNGWNESEGALYFESCEGETWHSRNLELLFEEGEHQFYK